MSGSTIAHRWLSAVNVNVVVCGAGVVTTGVTADDVDGTFEASCDKSESAELKSGESTCVYRFAKDNREVETREVNVQEQVLRFLCLGLVNASII